MSTRSWSQGRGHVVHCREAHGRRGCRVRDTQWTKKETQLHAERTRESHSRVPGAGPQGTSTRIVHMCADEKFTIRCCRPNMRIYTPIGSIGADASGSRGRVRGRMSSQRHKYRWRSPWVGAASSDIAVQQVQARCGTHDATGYYIGFKIASHSWYAQEGRAWKGGGEERVEE